VEKQNLSELFSGMLFKIPDYQRGYAWEEKQWNDFIEDIDALISDRKVKYHYTGTIVTFTPPNQTDVIYNRKPVKCVDVVDGQQRLTTVCLYLSVIIHALIKEGYEDYKNDIPDFLFCGETSKLTPANGTEDLFLQLLKAGTPRNQLNTPHEKRLAEAVKYFSNHIESILGDTDKGVEYLVSLYQAIISKLRFTYYTIEEECEIGMTFELMNSRGKGLSVLELLKNYFMHWVSRNVDDEEDRSGLTKKVNHVWKDVYENVGTSTGTESQCLRIAWTLYCHHLPKNWHGYDGFKEKEYVPLRDFSKKSMAETEQFLTRFVEGLANVSLHYACVVSPKEINTSSKTELQWLHRIHNTGNIANFLPLIVAARIHVIDKKVSEDEYIALLKSLECFSYRVFLVEGKRSNAGKSSFFRWGKELFDGDKTCSEITTDIYGLIDYYVNDQIFKYKIKEPFQWYGRKRLLKYTLFEYEQHLLDKDSKGQAPRITWKDLAKDSTLEHILPQNPEENSHWLMVWTDEDIKKYKHDIGNFVLTRDNSSYKNFEFERKKGQAGNGICYANSDIRQERKIADYSDWTKEELQQRREELEAWILDRWKVPEVRQLKDIVEDEDEDNELEGNA